MTAFPPPDVEAAYNELARARHRGEMPATLPPHHSSELAAYAYAVYQARVEERVTADRDHAEVCQVVGKLHPLGLTPEGSGRRGLAITRYFRAELREAEALDVCRAAHHLAYPGAVVAVASAESLDRQVAVAVRHANNGQTFCEHPECDTLGYPPMGSDRFLCVKHSAEAWATDPSRCDYEGCECAGTERNGDRHYCPAHFLAVALPARMHG